VTANSETPPIKVTILVIANAFYNVLLTVKGPDITAAYTETRTAAVYNGTSDMPFYVLMCR